MNYELVNKPNLLFRYFSSEYYFSEENLRKDFFLRKQVNTLKVGILIHEANE